MTTPDLCFTPATELARLFRARKASPLEVMQAVFARIDAVNPQLNAYVTLAREVLSLRVPTEPLAHRLVTQALVVEDRQDAWQRLGQRVRGRLPESPGVYVMRDAAGRAIYVGKAKNLRRRVSTYFSARRWLALPPGIPAASAIEWQQVGSELEALLVEAELIDRLLPPVNVQTEAPRRGLRRRRALVRDVIVVLPSADPDCAEIVCARAEDGAWLRQRTRRDGQDLAVHARRITRFFHGVGRRPGVESNRRGAAGIVFAWLGGAGRQSSRLDPHETPVPAELRRRLAALLSDRELFEDRIDQRGPSRGMIRA